MQHKEPLACQRTAGSVASQRVLLPHAASSASRAAVMPAALPLAAHPAVLGAQSDRSFYRPRSMQLACGPRAEAWTAALQQSSAHRLLAARQSSLQWKIDSGRQVRG